MNMRDRLKLLMFSLLSVNCATIELDQLKKVKTVAIIAVEGRIPGDGGRLTSFLNTLIDKEFMPKLHETVAAQLQTTLRWKVLPLAKVAASSSIRVSSKKTTSKIMELMAFKDSVLTIPGILQPGIAAGELDRMEWRKKLAKETAADSFLVYTFSATTQQSFGERLLPADLSGISIQQLDCNVSVQLFTLGQKDPIWSTGFELGGSADKPLIKIYGITFSDARQAAVVGACSRALAKHLEKVKLFESH
jgi:hypothetical protein